MYITHTIIHQNVNGIRTHTQEKLATLTKAYIISIHDTRLRHNQDLLQTIFPDYIIHELKHDKNTGIAILVYKTIRHTLVATHNKDGHKSITIKITDNKIFHQDLYITSYFVPPPSSRHKTLLNTEIIKRALQHKHAIITGDFNARHTDLGCTGTNQHGRQLHKLLLDSDYTILNDTQQPTFTHTGYDFSDCLDYMIATKDLLSSISSCFIDTDNGSDHLPITTTLKNQTKNIKNSNINTYNYQKTNWDSFTNILQQNTTSDQIQNITTPEQVETHTNKIIHTIQTAIQQATPKFKTPNNQHPRLPTETLTLIKSRKHLRKIQTRNNTQEIRKQINELNKAIKKAVHSIKNKIEQNKSSIIQQGPKNSKFWSTLKSLINPTSHFQTSIKHNDTTITTPQDKANIFLEHFKNIFTSPDTHSAQQNYHHLIETQLPDLSAITARDKQHELTKDITLDELKQTLRKTKSNSAPGPDLITYEIIKHLTPNTLTWLTTIYNAILDTTHIPQAFKTSTITVIPKPNKDLTNVASYRPITLTSTLGKLFEKIIATRLNQFATTQHIIKQHQTGFRKHHDAAENIIHLIQTTVQSFNQNKCTLLITMDLKQAFDRTWHSGLLHTLHANTNHHFTKIIHSFLTDRIINTKIDNTLSAQHFSPTQGVPQGSPLSPILFNIFISTAPHNTTDNTFIYNYADDTSFTSTAQDPKTAWSQVQPLIEQYITWTEQYKITIQPDKTKTIFLTRKRAIADNQYPTCTIQNKNVSRSTQLTFLGAHLDIHLTMRPHITKINDGTHYIINKIRHIFTKNKRIPAFVGLLLYKTLIRTRFTYAAPILSFIKPSLWRPLEHTQNKAIRAALRTGISTKISTLHKRANMPTIQEHYKEVSKNTLTRYINNANITLLKTLFSTARKKYITFWTPPLDDTFNQFTPNEQAHIKQNIQRALH